MKKFFEDTNLSRNPPWIDISLASWVLLFPLGTWPLLYFYVFCVCEIIMLYSMKEQREECSSQPRMQHHKKE